MQLDEELVIKFRGNGWKQAVETNGTLPLPFGLDWVTVSPKLQAVTNLKKCDEVKYVVGAGGGLPVPLFHADHLFLSPAFRGLEPDLGAITRCVELVKENPRWRLSVQLHKLIGIR